MKDENSVSWLGKVPENWQVLKIGDLYTLRNEKVSDVDYMPLSVTMKGIVPQLATAAKSDDHNNRKLVMTGDFVINSRSDRRGSCGISKYDGSVSLINTVITPRREMDPVFFDWLFHTEQFADEFYKWGHGIVDDLWTTNWQEMKSILIAVPPIEEQKDIAKRISEKCVKIDRVIKDIETSVEEFRNVKAAIINEKVTKGIKENRIFKESGIEWFKKIPTEWKTGKTIFVLKMPITDGPHTTPELFDDGIPFISAEAVSCGNGSIDFSHMRGYISQEFYDECCLKYIPEINDIYMIKSGATTGKVSIVDTDRKFTIWSPLAVFRANPEVMYYKYLFYFLQAEAYQKQVQQNWSYGTQQNIGMRVLEKLKICIPELKEQHEIADYLDEKCSRLDSIILEKEKLLENLKDYRKAMIYEMVTGKER